MHSAREVPETARGPQLIAPAPRLGADAALSGAQWQAEVRRIEARGFDVLAVSEHYTAGWTMEPLSALAFAAAVSHRLRVLPLVLNNDLRHPAILAKAIATTDVLSGGRVMLGLGAGWLAADYAALGVTFDRAGTRVDRFAEALAVIRGFFDGPSVEFTGRHYATHDLEALPAPVRAGGPPILVGGGGPRVLRIAGRFADIVGVHVTLGAGGFDAEAARELALEPIVAKIAIATRAAVESDRERPSFQFTPAVVVVDGQRCAAHRPGFTDYIAAHPDEFAETPAVLIGSARSVADQLRRWQAELGIELWHLGSNLDAIGAVIDALRA